MADPALRMNHNSRLIGPLALIAALLGAAIWLQHVRERSFPLGTVEDEALYLTTGRAARHVAVAYQSLAADMYWIRAIQYYGGTKRMLAGERRAPENAATSAGAA